MIYEATSFECSRIAQDLQIRKVQVESVVQLFNEGNTVPFITRYRKERTGGLDEDAIRSIQNRLNFLKQLNERKQTILRSIENQGKLTEDLRHRVGPQREGPRRAGERIQAVLSVQGASPGHSAAPHPGAESRRERWSAEGEARMADRADRADGARDLGGAPAFHGRQAGAG